MTKRERLYALVEERAGLQRRLTDIDAEIDELFEGRGTTRPGRRPQRRKEATADAGSNAAGGSRPSPPATNGSGRKPGPIREEIVKLAKEGMSRSDIAAKLGLKGRDGVTLVGNHLYRARQAGTLPKAEASR
jgi:hypothetical protein